MESKLFVTAEEVSKELGISKPFAYKLIREMNAELKERGFIVISGRLSRKFYEERLYGISVSEEKEVSHAGIQG